MTAPTDTIHRLGAGQAAVAYTGTAGNSAAVGATTYKVRVTVSTAAFIKIDKTAVATVADTYMPADRPEVFRCNPGMRVSAIQSAAGGNLFVTELDD